MAEDNSRFKQTKQPLSSNKAPLSNKSSNTEERASLFEKNSHEKHIEDVISDSSDDSLLACLSESSSDDDCVFEDARYSDLVSLGEIKLTSECHKPVEQVSRKAVLEYLQRKLSLSPPTLQEPMPSTSGMEVLQNTLSSLQRSIPGLEPSTSGMEVLRNRLSSPSLLDSHWRSPPRSPPLSFHHDTEASTSGMEVLQNRLASIRRPLPETEPSTSGIDVFLNTFTSPPRRSHWRPPSPSPPRRSPHEPGPSTSATKVFRRRHSFPCRDSPISLRHSPTNLPTIPSSRSLTDSVHTSSLRPSSPSLTVPPPSLAYSLRSPSPLTSLHTSRSSSPPLRPRHSLPILGDPHSRFLFPTPPCPILPLSSDSAVHTIQSSLLKYTHAGLHSPNTSALKPADIYQVEDSTSAESAPLRLHDILKGPPISQALLESPPPSPSSVPMPSNRTRDLRISKMAKPDSKKETVFTSLIQAIALTEERKFITEPDVHDVGSRRKGGPYKNQRLLWDPRLKKPGEGL